MLGRLSTRTRDRAPAGRAACQGEVRGEGRTSQGQAAGCPPGGTCVEQSTAELPPRLQTPSCWRSACTPAPQLHAHRGRGRVLAAAAGCWVPPAGWVAQVWLVAAAGHPGSGPGLFTRTLPQFFCFFVCRPGCWGLLRRSHCTAALQRCSRIMQIAPSRPVAAAPVHSSDRGCGPSPAAMCILPWGPRRCHRHLGAACGTCYRSCTAGCWIRRPPASCCSGGLSSRPASLGTRAAVSPAPSSPGAGGRGVARLLWGGMIGHPAPLPGCPPAPASGGGGGRSHAGWLRSGDHTCRSTPG
jgi:hypothetical protein